MEAGGDSLHPTPQSSAAKRVTANLLRFRPPDIDRSTREGPLSAPPTEREARRRRGPAGPPGTGWRRLPAACPPAWAPRGRWPGTARPPPAAAARASPPRPPPPKTDTCRSLTSASRLGRVHLHTRGQPVAQLERHARRGRRLHHHVHRLPTFASAGPFTASSSRPGPSRLPRHRRGQRQREAQPRHRGLRAHRPRVRPAEPGAAASSASTSRSAFASKVPSVIVLPSRSSTTRTCDGQRLRKSATAARRHSEVGPAIPPAPRPAGSPRAATCPGPPAAPSRRPSSASTASAVASASRRRLAVRAHHARLHRQVRRAVRRASSAPRAPSCAASPAASPSPRRWPGSPPPCSRPAPATGCARRRPWHARENAAARCLPAVDSAAPARTACAQSAVATSSRCSVQPSPPWQVPSGRWAFATCADRRSPSRASTGLSGWASAAWPAAPPWAHPARGLRAAPAAPAAREAMRLERLARPRVSPSVCSSAGARPASSSVYASSASPRARPPRPAPSAARPARPGTPAAAPARCPPARPRAPPASACAAPRACPRACWLTGRPVGHTSKSRTTASVAAQRGPHGHRPRPGAFTVTYSTTLPCGRHLHRARAAALHRAPSASSFRGASTAASRGVHHLHRQAHRVSRAQEGRHHRIHVRGQRAREARHGARLRARARVRQRQHPPPRQPIRHLHRHRRLPGTVRHHQRLEEERLREPGAARAPPPPRPWTLRLPAAWAPPPPRASLPSVPRASPRRSLCPRSSSTS